MIDTILEISLFGACIIRSSDNNRYEISGTKQKALLVLLATAPFGRRTRTFLQDILWGTACFDSGRQSLRRALSDIKKLMGEDYSQVLSSSNTEIILNIGKIKFISNSNQGEFLEGIDIKENGFNEWLRSARMFPKDLHNLIADQKSENSIKVAPIVSILPFQTILGDENNGVLGDWMAEEISRSLSRSNLLAVISHLSARQFSDRNVDLLQLRTCLETDYCLTGCIRQTGTEIIVDADFIDVESGIILWTRQFKGKTEQFLSLTAPGISEIVLAIGRSVADDSLNYQEEKILKDIPSHRLLIASASLMHKPALRDFARSKVLIEEVLERAPRVAEVFAWKSKWHILSVFNGWSTDQKVDTQQALDCTARALDIDPENSFCLTMDGFANNHLLQRMDVSAQRYERALALNPNNSLGWLFKGALHSFRDQGEEAVGAVDKARLLSPIDPFGYYYDSLSASAYLSANKYEKALEFASQSLAKNDRHLSTIRAKITALHCLDRGDEMRMAGKQLLNRKPNYTVSTYLESHPASSSRMGAMVATALEASGIAK